MQAANGGVQVGSDRLKNGQIASRCANTQYRFQIFNGKYHAIIEIVECESGRIGSKMVKLRVDVRIHSVNFNLSMANTMRILKQSNASRVEQLKNGRVRVGYANMRVLGHSLNITYIILCHNKTLSKKKANVFRYFSISVYPKFESISRIDRSVLTLWFESLGSLSSPSFEMLMYLNVFPLEGL